MSVSQIRVCDTKYDKPNRIAMLWDCLMNYTKNKAISNAFIVRNSTQYVILLQEPRPFEGTASELPLKIAANNEGIFELFDTRIRILNNR